MSLPSKFSYLNKVVGLPKVVAEGLKLYGTWEFGKQLHNPVIMGWAKALGIEKIYTNDEMPWCGLSMAYVLTRAGKFIPFKSWDLLRALKYQSFGVKVPVKDAALGDVLIFKRDGGGHVGIYVGESTDTFFVLGGNQGNQYNITEIAKSRCVAARRPVYQVQPQGVRKFILDSSGKLSTNEA